METKITQHTPTPWEVSDRVFGSTSNPETHIYWKAPYQNDGSRYHIATVSYPSNMEGSNGAAERKANAAFIVRAVNAHEELVQVMCELKDRLMMQQDKYGHDNREEIGWCVEAIAKAEGK